MTHRSTTVALALVFGLATPALAADKTRPVRMGCGLMTFDTVPGWCLGPDGKSVIGPCHGGVAVDKEGAIYTSAQAGVFVFSPEGKVLRSFLGDKYSNIHDLKVREEAGGEFVVVSVREVLAGTTQIAVAAEETSGAAAGAATAARQQARGSEDLAAAIEEIASLADELGTVDA